MDKLPLKSLPWCFWSYLDCNPGSCNGTKICRLPGTAVLFYVTRIRCKFYIVFLLFHLILTLLWLRIENRFFSYGNLSWFDLGSICYLLELCASCCFWLRFLDTYLHCRIVWFVLRWFVCELWQLTWLFLRIRTYSKDYYFFAVSIVYYSGIIQFTKVYKIGCIR